jgi:hypothetical protein
MQILRTARRAGWLFIVGALLVNVPYALLIANFEYPDILRQPTGEILEKFSAGGSSLILTWLAFAWAGFLLIAAIMLLHSALGATRSPWLPLATALGFTGGVVQMVGLLRWVFVVPVLAAIQVDPTASSGSREAAAVGFQLVHQYGGVVLGEHLGQLFSIGWMVLISALLLRHQLLGRWLGLLGYAAAAVYVCAQSELLATVIPGFPVEPEAGLVGSLLWLIWMIVLGVQLLRAKSLEVTSHNE